jgi:hypothetical protein
MANEKIKPDADDSDAKNPKAETKGKQVTTEVKIKDGYLAGFNGSRQQEAARAFAEDNGITDNEAWAALNQASKAGSKTAKVTKSK